MRQTRLQKTHHLPPLGKLRSFAYLLLLVIANSSWLLANETVSLKLDVYYFYQEKWGATCFVEIDPPVVTLVAEIENNAVIQARLLGFSDKHFLPGELEGIEIQKDEVGRYWLRRLPLSARLISWILIKKKGCPYSWTPIRSVDPAVVFAFDEAKLGDNKKTSYSERVYFQGLGVFRRPYVANMLVGQSH